MAKTFGQLPSYVLANGTIFDIEVANALAEYENRLMSSGTSKPVPKMSTEQMMEMMKSVRENNAKNNQKVK